MLPINLYIRITDTHEVTDLPLSNLTYDERLIKLGNDRSSTSRFAYVL